MQVWAPFAVRKPGPANKRGYQGFGFTGPKRGIVDHSAEGSAGGLLDVLHGPRRASWHFSILKDGTVWQHYPIDTHCWHAGDADDDDGVAANIELIGKEHEGREGEPLTQAQFLSSVQVTRWCAEQYGRTSFVRFVPGLVTRHWLLAEHNEVSNNPTACPSGRIPWARMLSVLNREQPAPDPVRPRPRPEPDTSLTDLAAAWKDDIKDYKAALDVVERLGIRPIFLVRLSSHMSKRAADWYELITKGGN